MGDIFTGRRILQPKREIMEYLASEGIKVAPFYDSIGDAIKDSVDKTILLRSEHPQDYEGSSDLFPGRILNESMKAISPDEITRKIIADADGQMNEVKLHCKLLGLDYKAFISDFSHSAWEHIYGTNRSVFADSAIEGRYHILTLSPSSYNRIDTNRNSCSCMGSSCSDRIHKSEAKDIIRLYEAIRNLLDKNHCYVVEVQSVPAESKIENYALQVHRGVDFCRSEFNIEETPSREYRDYVETLHVRGATKESGEEILLTINYPDGFADNPYFIEEDASMEASVKHVAPVFSEIMFRKRKLQLLIDSEDAPFQKELTKHVSRSSIFKPLNSAIVDKDDLFKCMDYKRLWSKDLEQARVHYVSDGNKAYLGFIE